jgi:glycine betaine/proline transport system ATP-binding protein
VPHDTLLSELFIPAVESELPLGVLDDRGRLVGVVSRVTLLAALAGTPDADAHAGLRPDPLPTEVVDQALDAAVESGSIAISHAVEKDTI